jgi:hypothetical protein
MKIYMGKYDIQSQRSESNPMFQSLFQGFKKNIFIMMLRFVMMLAHGLDHPIDILGKTTT